MKRVAVVTGASRGLGADVAVAFGRAGYRVVIGYLSRGADAEEVRARIERDGGEARCLRADVGERDEAEALIDQARGFGGRLDVLVNNAGIAHESLLVRTRERDWDRVMKTNLTGAFHCSRAAARQMMRQRSGHIINIGSILGLRGARGESAYAASKAALMGLTKSLARELGRKGVRVNLVIPGFLLTDMTSGMTEEARSRVKRLSALGRFSDPALAASFIVFLAGLECVTGQVFSLESRIHRWA